MTDKEIVQALRCCAEGECKDCAMHEDKQRCQENLLDKAAEAIERLTAENAALREKVPLTEDAMINLAAQVLGVEPSRLRELAEADKDGRCVVLPCKVGGYSVAHCPGRRTTHHTGRSTRYVLRGRYDAVRRAGRRESYLYREIRKNCIFEPRRSREGFAGNGGQEGWLN